MRERGIAEPILVRNGADPELLEAADPATVSGLLDRERVSLVYTGRFGSTGRDPGPLLEAIGRLAASRPDDAGRLELVVAGPLTDGEQQAFARDVSPARINVVGSLDREKALALQRSADALLLVAHPIRSQLANFKLYEYLSAGPPVLALAEGTEAGTVVAGFGGKVVPAGDVEAITEALALAARGGLPASDPDARAEHAYPAVAERMEAAVESALSNRKGEG